jgi:hypothetical protein
MAVAARTPRFVAVTVLGLLAALGVVVMLHLLAADRAPRFDVTGTGALRLSPRTRDVIERAGPGTEIVLAVRGGPQEDPARGPGQVRRLLDMLEEIGRAGPGVRITVIDTASAQGLSEFDALVGRLAERDAQATAQAVEALTLVLASAEDAARVMRGLAGRIEALRPHASPTGADELADRASLLRVTADKVAPMAEAVRGMVAPAGGGPLPDVARARSVLLDSTAALRTLLTVTSNALAQPGESLGLTGQWQTEAKAVAADAAGQAELVGAAGARAESMPLPAAARVAGALRADEAMLVLGPDSGTGSSITAIALDDVFVPTPPGMPPPDPGRKAEVLLANAISLLDGSPRPLVVLAHAGTSRVLRSGGQGPLGLLVRRSAWRGIDWAEWPVAIEPAEPAAVLEAQAAGRPVVYVMVGIDTAAAGGAERAVRAGTVLSTLLQQGRPLLVCLAPSALPGLGEPDSTARAIEPLGLSADTGRAVLIERGGGASRSVAWESTVVGFASDRPVASSVAGLSVLLPWPTVIDLQAVEGVSAWPVLTLPGESGAWREGEWLSYWLTGAQQRGLLADKPAPGGTRDGDIGAGVLAWAVQSQTGPRTVVVGSNLWLFDDAADRPASIDGRLVPTSPGNAELFLSSVEWLAGNDHLLSPGGEAAQTPTVQPIEPGRLAALRWGLSAGLPLLVLIAGVCCRVLFG